MHLALRIQAFIEAAVTAALDNLKDTKHDCHVVTASRLDMLAYGSRFWQGPLSTHAVDQSRRHIRPGRT